MIMDESRASGGIKVDRRNEVLEENLPHYPFVHYRPHMIWDQIQVIAMGDGNTALYNLCVP
jgi:hypothetical protein